MTGSRQIKKSMMHKALILSAFSLIAKLCMNQTEKQKIISIVSEAIEKLNRIKHLQLAFIGSTFEHDWLKLELCDNFLYNKDLYEKNGAKAGNFYVIIGSEYWEETSTVSVDLPANISSDLPTEQKIVLRFAYQIYALFHGYIVNYYNEIKSPEMPIGNYKNALAWYNNL